SDQAGWHQQNPPAVRPVRRPPAGVFARTAPPAAMPDGGVRAPVAQLRANPASTQPPTAVTARSGSADRGEVPPSTPVAPPITTAVHSRRSPIERIDTLPARQPVPEAARPWPRAQRTSDPVEVSSLHRQAVRGPAVGRAESLRDDAADTERAVSPAARRLPSPERMGSRAAPSRLAVRQPTNENDASMARNPSGPGGRQATKPPPAPTSPGIHIDIGRIQIELPRAPSQARRSRAEPPALQGKPRGGPDG